MIDLVHISCAALLFSSSFALSPQAHRLPGRPRISGNVTSSYQTGASSFSSNTLSTSSASRTSTRSSTLTKSYGTGSQTSIPIGTGRSSTLTKWYGTGGQTSVPTGTGRISTLSTTLRPSNTSSLAPTASLNGCGAVSQYYGQTAQDWQTYSTLKTPNQSLPHGGSES